MSNQIHLEPLASEASPVAPRIPPKVLGYSAALLTVLIWSSYFLSLRFGALSPLGILDLALFRFCIPGLILTPLLLKQRRKILAVPVRYLLGIMLGAGLPFFLLSAAAMNWSRVADGSTLIPGAAPLFVTALTVLVFKEPLSRIRGLGLMAIVAGVFCFLYSSLIDPGYWLLQGHLLFLVCSALWAVFTISVRQSGLKPLEVAGILTAPSAVLLLFWMLFTQPDLTWDSLNTVDLLMLMFVQGIVVGLGSGFFYSYAITRLGAEITSAIGSLTPVSATLLAALLLHEGLEIASLSGSVLVTLGVICCSGLFNRFNA